MYGLIKNVKKRTLHQLGVSFLIQQHVLWFQVSVDDALAVEESQSLQNTGCVETECVLIERTPETNTQGIYISLSSRYSWNWRYYKTIWCVLLTCRKNTLTMSSFGQPVPSVVSDSCSLQEKLILDVLLFVMLFCSLFYFYFLLVFIGWFVYTLVNSMNCCLWKIKIKKKDRQFLE